MLVEYGVQAPGDRGFSSQASPQRHPAQPTADAGHSDGARLEIAGVAVRERDRPREVTVDPQLLTTDGMALATRPDVDIVIELIGGIEPARTLLLAALSAGKSVVTANKALVATDRAVLHKTASQAGSPAQAGNPAQARNQSQLCEQQKTARR